MSKIRTKMKGNFVMRSSVVIKKMLDCVKSYIWYFDFDKDIVSEYQGSYSTIYWVFGCRFQIIKILYKVFTI